MCGSGRKLHCASPWEEQFPRAVERDSNQKTITFMLLLFDFSVRRRSYRNEFRVHVPDAGRTTH